MFGFRKPKINQEHMARLGNIGAGIKTGAKEMKVISKEGLQRMGQRLNNVQDISIRADKAMNDFGSIIDGKKFDSFIMGGKIELPRGRLNEYDQRVRTMRTGV